MTDSNADPTLDSKPEPKPEILLAYASAATIQFGPAELADLLKVAREKNARLGITGLLLFVDDSFFQILEGEPDSLRALYSKIVADKRHDKIVKLLEEQIEERAFSSWSMGHADVTREELATIPGLNDLMTFGTHFIDIGPGRARKLVTAFKEGKWRMRMGR